jgi:hypothetical protein
MNVEAIREWLNRLPFEPFVLRLSNGEEYQVRHPGLVALSRTRLAIADDEKDQFTHVALIHVNSISALQAA